MGANFSTNKSAPKWRKGSFFLFVVQADRAAAPLRIRAEKCILTLAVLFLVAIQPIFCKAWAFKHKRHKRKGGRTIGRKRDPPRLHVIHIYILGFEHKVGKVCHTLILP